MAAELRLCLSRRKTGFWSSEFLPCGRAADRFFGLSAPEGFN